MYIFFLDNSDSESEYSGNLGLAKQYNKKSQQTLKTTKSDNDTVVKTEPSNSHGQKKTHPKTYPSKELLMQRSLPRKPKSSMIKVHSNVIEETKICEQITLKAPFNLNLEDNKNLKTHKNGENDALIHNEPKVSKIHYLCPKKQSEKHEQVQSTVLESFKTCNDQIVNDLELPTTLIKSQNSCSNLNELSSETIDKINQTANEEFISGTDFDLNKIRSEMKGFTPTSASIEPFSKSTHNLLMKDRKTESKILETIDSDSDEDIYEFKESDPYDFKAISTAIDEKIRNRMKNIDPPVSYNFLKSSEVPKVNKTVPQDEKNNSVLLEITEENESNNLFESNSISGIDTCVLIKDDINKDKFVLENETDTKNIFENQSDESIKSNSSSDSNSNNYTECKQDFQKEICDIEVNNAKDQVLNLCIKPPESPSNNIFNMSETNDSNVVEFDDEDDETKLVIADFQIDSDSHIVDKKRNFSSGQTENLLIESSYSNLSQSPKMNSEFRSSYELKGNVSSKECTDDESTISCNESIQNDSNFQLYSQFENELTKKKVYQPYVDNENSSQSGFEFESNLKSSINKNSEVESSDITNNDNCIKYDYTTKTKFEKESTPVLQELQCKEYMSEDSLNNSLGVGYEIYKPKTSKDSSLEAIETSVVKNECCFETNTSHTVKSTVIENNSKDANLYDNIAPSAIKNSFFKNSNSIPASSVEAGVNNVLFCEETIPGSPNGVSEELIDQEDRIKLPSAHCAERETPSTTICNMHQSFCNPINTLMNSVNNKIEEHTDDIQK